MTERERHDGERIRLNPAPPEGSEVAPVGIKPDLRRTIEQNPSLPDHGPGLPGRNERREYADPRMLCGTGRLQAFRRHRRPWSLPRFLGYSGRQSHRRLLAMTYLVAADLPTAPAGERFRALLARPGILQMPGAHNGQAALQAKAAGFDALYLSGAAMTASMGVPDVGIITVDEVCFFIRQVARASGLPVLVDGDTGYGEALNVMHMVRSFEDAGAAAVHIEDQLLPKKCGHLNDKKLADPHDMAAKIAAARRARRHLYIIARTDAAASEGIDGAVARAKLFMDAGADAIFPEALITA